MKTYTFPAKYLHEVRAVLADLAYRIERQEATGEELVPSFMVEPKASGTVTVTLDESDVELAQIRRRRRIA